MVATLKNLVSWSANRTDEGGRVYDAKFLVYTSTPLDGPAIVMNCPGLPAIGSYWDYDNDVDIWAFCTPYMKLTPLTVGEPCTEWHIEQRFQTFQPGGGGNLERCQTASVENPLFEPQRLSGSFLRFSRRATKDRNNQPITSFSHEPIKGPEVDFDEGIFSVRVGMNLAFLPLSTAAPMMNNVNDSAMWGVNARCVKLSGMTWQRLMYGLCTFYYTVDYDFEVNTETWDRKVESWGHTKLRQGGTVSNPDHFELIVDERGNPSGPKRITSAGAVWDGAGDPPTKTIEKYKNTNFFVLGIPASL